VFSISQFKSIHYSLDVSQLTKEEHQWLEEDSQDFLQKRDSAPHINGKNAGISIELHPMEGWKMELFLVQTSGDFIIAG
jgi:hypothetical protein